MQLLRWSQPLSMYGYQDYYATQGRGPFGEPLRDLPDQEQGGVDEPESIQSDDNEEVANDLEGDSQPTTSRAKPQAQLRYFDTHYLQIIPNMIKPFKSG